MNKKGYCYFIIMTILVIIIICKDLNSIKPIATDKYKDVTEKEMLIVFQNAYGLSSLKEQQLFWDEKEQQVVMNFYFSKEVEDWHIDSAKKYVVDTFINKQLLSLGNPQLYQVWSYSQPISKAVIQVYKKGILIEQDTYKATE